MDMITDTDRQNNDPREEEEVVAVDDINISSQEDDIGATSHNDDHGDNDGGEDVDDFTFVFIRDDDDDVDGNPSSSPAGIYAFEDGQNFPLFDQKLLLDGTEYELEQVHDDQHLPFQPPVNRVFTELPPRRSGFIESSKKLDEVEDEAAGPFCSWSKDQATTSGNHTSSSSSSHDHGLISKKSNSTGFSKLWRLREKVHRSNSDGRDAFVFLKGGASSTDHKTTSSSSSSTKAAVISGSRRDDDDHGTFVKVVNNGNVNGSTTRKAKVVKKTTISAHEAYMRNRGGHTEEERRKSYLPYRPELMGFFTNVHGGLSKNVHPY